MSDVHKCVIKIGPYRLSRWTGLDGGYWLQHESGEGMQVGDKLIDLINEFYKKTF